MARKAYDPQAFYEATIVPETGLNEDYLNEVAAYLLAADMARHRGKCVSAAVEDLARRDRIELYCEYFQKKGVTVNVTPEISSRIAALDRLAKRARTWTFLDDLTDEEVMGEVKIVVGGIRRILRGR